MSSSMPLGDMDAVILAGGLGTRLRGVVHDRPKGMALVAGRPFLEWLLEDLRRQGIGRAVLSTGHMAEIIESHFRERPMAGIEVVCSREPEPLGTGGAVKLALARVRGPRFFTLNGDSCCDFDVRRLHATHRENAALATLWLVPVDDTSRYGAVELNRQQEVVRFAEKAGSSGPGLINAGVYLLERRIFDDIDRPAFSLEKDVFPGLVGKELRGVAGAGPFIDIGTPESYRLADQFMKQRGV